MALIDKLTAIADGFRSSRSITDALSLDQMAELAAEKVSSDEVISHVDIPQYVKDAAIDLAQKVNSVRTDDSIVFIAMSDSHHCGEQSDTDWNTNTNIGNLHAGMAAKTLAYILDMDFACYLGDYTFGNSTTTSELLHQQIEEMNLWLDEAYKGIPQFRTVGNHDTGMYAYEEGNAEMETSSYLFNAIGSYCDGAVYGSEEFGYCYRDFEEKKLRVICLNTSEGDTLNASYECSPAQLLWFSQTLYDVGSKDDASEWKIIVLGHYPLDFNNAYPASSVVKAYVDGGSVTQNGTTINFNGYNSAKFVAQFHGHTHCFKYAKLNVIDEATSTATEYDAWRVAVPNASYYRNNHQSGPSKHGIYFEEDVTYNKIINSKDDTAFVVNVINPNEDIIYSFCYGAGRDRMISYGSIVYYGVVASVSNATISNESLAIADGESFIATLSPNKYCKIDTVKITMGGNDITSSVYSSGTINIPSVTGDIVISVRSIPNLACTNQIPISTDTSGNIYNEFGYKDGVYVQRGEDVDQDGIAATGFIPIWDGAVIRFDNMNFTKGYANYRLSFYDENKTFIGHVQANSTYYTESLFNGVLDDNNNYIQFTLKNNIDNVTSGAAFVRICCENITDMSVVTVDEEILYVDDLSSSYTITNVLTNVTNSNTSSSVAGGSAYTATLSWAEGKSLGSITVTMGGVDITSSVYSNGVINIPFVTGNVIITAFVLSYVNQIPISTDTDGSVFNSTGYQSGYRLGSSGTLSGLNGSYVTGFIPCKVGDVVYMKNVTFQYGITSEPTSNNQRLSFYDADKNHLAQTNATGLGGVAAGVKGDDNIWTQFTPKATMNSVDCSSMAYFRINAAYIGSDSIITVNEVID